jgi:hypothetical protein
VGLVTIEVLCLRLSQKLAKRSYHVAPHIGPLAKVFLATDFTNSHGFLNKSVEICEIRGKELDRASML